MVNPTDVNYTTTAGVQNATTPYNVSAEPEEEIPKYVGYICVIITSLLYGTNYIPVKKFETGDGMFFQWVFCNAVLICGLVIQMVRRSTFYPLAITGGLIWATGNLCVVPIVKSIGLGLGLCIWASTMLLVGWANGRFGLVGIKPEIPSDTTMNYIGTAFCLVSAILYVLVKPEMKSPASTELNMNKEDEMQPSNDLPKAKDERATTSDKEEKRSYIETLPIWMKKVIGVTLSVFSGFMYAVEYIPPTYIQENEEGASQNSLDYVFAHFCGIHIGSTFYFIIYVIYRRNKPHVYPQVILPALVSGSMWGVATALFFVINMTLSQAVSFPIISTVPMGMSLAIGILVFQEIKGRRNFIVVIVGMIFTVAGAILTGLSKA